MRKLLLLAASLPLMFTSCFNNELSCGDTNECIDAFVFANTGYYDQVTTVKTRATFDDIFMTTINTMDLNGNWKTIFSGADLYDSSLTDLMRGWLIFDFHCISQDGRHILISYLNPQERWITRVYNLHTKAFSEIVYQGNDMLIKEAAFSPDGTKIVYTENDGNTIVPTNVCVMNSDGTGKTVVLAGLTDHFNAYSEWMFPSFTPDNSRIVLNSMGWLGICKPIANATLNTFWIPADNDLADPLTTTAWFVSSCPFSTSRVLFLADGTYDGEGSNLIGAVNYDPDGYADTPAAATLDHSVYPEIYNLLTVNPNGDKIGALVRNNNNGTTTVAIWNFDGNSTLSGRHNYNLPENTGVEFTNASVGLRNVDKQVFTDAGNVLIPDDFGGGGGE